MTGLSKSDAELILQQMLTFIEHDIDAAISGNANYLAALGLSSYTEIIGGFIRGDLSQGSGGRNFTEFITKYMRQYLPVNASLQAAGKNGLYGAVRSGFTHTYYMKGKSKVDMGQIPGLTCGITFDTATTETVFYVPRYFVDFITGFRKYFSDFSTDTTGSFLSAFNNALSTGDSGFLTSTGQLTGSSGNTIVSSSSGPI